MTVVGQFPEWKSPTTLQPGMRISRSNPVRSVALLLLLASAANAQDPPATTSSPASPEAALAARRQAVEAQLANVRERLARAGAGTTTAPALPETDLLESTKVIFDQLEAQYQRQSELQESIAQLEAELAALRAAGPSEARPDSFLLLETTRDERAALSGRSGVLAASRDAAQAALDDARKQRDEAERRRRTAKESLETNQSETARAELATSLNIAELESRLARETFELRKIEKENQSLQQQVHDLRSTLLAEKVAWIEERARFTQEDLDAQLEKVARAELEQSRRLEKAKLEMESTARRLASLRQRRDAAPDPSPALDEQIEAARMARETRQIEITLLGERIQRLARVNEVWMRRYQVINGQASADDLTIWDGEARADASRLKLSLELYAEEIGERRRTLATLELRTQSSAEAAPESVGPIREQIQQVQAQISLYEKSITVTEQARRLQEKLISEIGAERATVTVGERLRLIWSAVLRIWRYELFVVDDRPITVSKVVVGILLVVVGAVASKFLSVLIAGRLLPRLRVAEGAAAAIQSVLFYTLLLTFGLLALRIVNVPLTAFAILGGALAIGLGFGSQALMNNFISGLILLVERPIRVGDLIEMQELLGVVEHIGPRSTRVRRPENVEIIVPNSAFLQENVTNWTLTDDRYRAKVSVGVIYGSPTRDVARLIRHAVEEHGKVLPKPEPILLFSDFGDSALIFEVHFWIRMRRLMDRRIIESDIRFRIDSLFREANIVIAFPQRDVHLDSKQPIEIQLLKPDGPGDDAIESL